MLTIKQFVSKSIKAIVWSAGFFFPINKKKIVCCSCIGKGYSDNPKYIVEEMHKKDEYEIIWLLSDMSFADTLPNGIIACNMNSISAIYHLLTASVWIDNFRKKFRYKKKKTLYIQTWHGGGAGKKSEKDVIDTLNKTYVKMAIKDAKNTDIMIAPDKYAVDVYRNSFWFDGPIATIGYPRCVPFFSDEKEIIRNRVYEFFNIPCERGIVLYAPTFRKDNEDYLLSIDFSKILNALHKKTERNFVVLTHMHINVESKGNALKYDNSTLINGNAYPDMQELLVAAEVLISDYSSVSFDFALMKKPVFRYLPDLKAYQTDRDMYIPIDEYPYPYAENNDELEKIILEFDKDLYLKNLENFMNRIGALYNKNAAKRVCEYISTYSKNGLNKKKIYEAYKEDFC